MSDPNSPAPPRSSAGRILSLVTGTVVGLLALALLAVGGVALWADGEKDDQGYLSTSTERYATGTHALATENLDLDLSGAESVMDSEGYGNVRLRVASNDDKPVFVGIARTSDVESYLDRTSHATVTDVETAPFRAEYRDHRGDHRPAAPGLQRFWAASAQGTGAQTLKWDVQDGQWSVVVMNADGSAGVDAGVSAGAKVPFLPAVGWGFLGGGAVLLLTAGAFLVSGLRAPRRDAGSAPSIGSAAPATAG